jgi:phytoene desaturase
VGGVLPPADLREAVQRMLAEVARISPSDVAGYKRFMAEADHCYRLGFEALGDKAFDTVGDLLKAAPAIVRMRGWRSLHTMVAAHIKHPKLRIVMSFHPLLIGGNPFSVTCVYSLIHILEQRWGVHSAMGGTGAIVNALVELLKDRRVPIRYNAPVTQIRVKDGKAVAVELENGELIGADIVVSNADAAWTYKYLIEEKYRPSWSNRRIEKGNYSSGLFVWYFGTNKQYKDVPHHMMVLGPRYKGLLQDIFKNHTLSKDFSLYLYRPTATDPSLAPHGCDTFYALSVVPNLSSGTDWPAITEQYRDAIATALQDSVLPGLKQHIVTSKVSTPQDFQDRLWSFKGAGFGLEPVITQSAWFRPHNRSEDIQNLFLVGAGTQPGAGVPSVLMSAKMLEQVVPHALAVY